MSALYQNEKDMLSFMNAPVTVKASGAITSDNVGTAVALPKGRYDLFFDVTALSTGTGFDVVTVVIERNVKSSVNEWTNVMPPVVIGGDATGSGEAVSTGDYVVSINNTGDYQIRVLTYLSGSATSITYACTAHPVIVPNS